MKSQIKMKMNSNIKRNQMNQIIINIKNYFIKIQIIFINNQNFKIKKSNNLQD